MVARLALIAPLVIAGVARAPQSEQDLVVRARGIHERMITSTPTTISTRRTSQERYLRLYRNTTVAS